MKLKSLKQFNRMTEQNKRKYLQKISRRANSRLNSLRSNNIHNEAVEIVESFHSGAVTENNKFYTGKKYSDEDLISSFNHINAFLQHEESTLKGVERAVKNKVDKAIADNSLNGNTMRKMSKKELSYANDYLAQKTNRKMKILAQHGEVKNAYGVAEQYLISKHAKNLEFETSKDLSNNKNSMKLNIQHMLKFNQSQTSTLKGIKDLRNRKVDMFREKGINVKNGDEDKFFDFLSSRQFAKLRSQADSNQIIQDFVESINSGKERDKINEEFQNFLDGEITYDQVQERLETAPWLLH